MPQAAGQPGWDAWPALRARLSGPPGWLTQAWVKPRSPPDTPWPRQDLLTPQPLPHAESPAQMASLLHDGGMDDLSCRGWRPASTGSPLPSSWGCRMKYRMPNELNPSGLKFRFDPLTIISGLGGERGRSALWKLESISFWPRLTKQSQTPTAPDLRGEEKAVAPDTAEGHLG